MGKKYKLKKEVYYVLIAIILVIIATIFIVTKKINKSYSIDYKVDNYNITENYDDKIKTYYFSINKDDITYDFIVNKDYIKDKKLLKEINTYEDDNTTCIEIISEQLDNYPLCSNDNEIIDYRLVSDNLKEELSSYYNTIDNVNEKILNYNIYNEDLDLLIWSYKGFNHIKGLKNNTYNIFSKDVYEIPISIKINNYILIADYEQKHEFNKFYIIDLSKEKITEWNIDYKISFDSYIAGINEESVFLIDNKNKKEYEIVPSYEKMRIVGTSNKDGIIYINGEETKLSMTKIISNKETFKYYNKYNYELDDNKLYLKYLENNNKTLVTKHNVDKIVNIDNDNIYYISSTDLYKYNIKYGEIKLLSYSELELNKSNKYNMIIINN